MDKVCDEDTKQEELSHIRKAFPCNGYPDKFISRPCAVRPSRRRPQMKKASPEKPKILSLLYCHGLSEHREYVDALELRQSLSPTTNCERN